MELLAPDVVMLSDGGPARHAARRPVVGPDRVARLIVNLARRVPPDGDVRIALVNGEPGLVFRAEGRVDFVLSLSFGADGRLRRIYSQVNPEKLRHVV